MFQCLSTKSLVLVLSYFVSKSFVHCKSVPKNQTDSLIPSASLFSSEEEDNNDEAVTDNYRQIFPFHPNIQAQHFQNFQNPNNNAHPFYPQQSPSFNGFGTPQYQQYLQQQQQQLQQQQQQSFLNPQVQQQQGSQEINYQSGNKKKKDKLGGNRRRKRPQKVSNSDDSEISDFPESSQISATNYDVHENTERPKRRRKRPQRIQPAEDQEEDQFGLHEASSIEPFNEKKRLKKKKISAETTELEDPNSKTENGEQRACPACGGGDCNANNIISGLPLIQIIGAIVAGAVWAGVFIFLYWNFIAIGKGKDNGGGYGYSPAPSPAYGVPMPAQSYGQPVAQNYGPPVSMSYGAPAPASGYSQSSGYSTRISYPTGRNNMDSLSNKVWNAIDSVSKTYGDNNKEIDGKKMQTSFI